MKFPINEETFVKMWCDYIGDADNTDKEFATAFVHAMNEAYRQGLKEGARKVGAA